MPLIFMSFSYFYDDDKHALQYHQIIRDKKGGQMISKKKNSNIYNSYMLALSFLQVCSTKISQTLDKEYTDG